MKNWFDVVLMWNPSDAAEGTFSALVLADDDKDAVHQTSAMMAASASATEFDTDAEREAWRRIIEAEPEHVGRADLALANSLLVVFQEDLGMPDVDRMQLDLSVLRQVLSQHKDALLVPRISGEI